MANIIVFSAKKTIFSYLLTWLLLFVAGFVNGSLREFTYKNFVGELSAHQISTVTLILLITLIVGFVYRRRPLENYTQCVAIGILWIAMTAAWEFLFGHYLMGHSWERLSHDYHLQEGRVWVFALLWMGWVLVFVRWLTERKKEDFGSRP